MQETINSANAAASTLFLGQNGEFWDFWLIISVVFAAFAAAAIGVATVGSIVSHKRETRATDQALTKFQSKTAGEIADANARAAEAAQKAVEAQLALERFKSPRLIAEAAKLELVVALLPFSGTKAAIYVLGDGPEPNSLAASIRDVLSQAHWEPLIWNWSGAGAAIGVVVLFKSGTEEQVGATCDAVVAALRSAHIDAKKEPWPGDWNHFGGMLNGPMEPAPTEAPIRIVIGSKPQ